MIITESNLRYKIRDAIKSAAQKKLQVRVNSLPLNVEVADTDGLRDIGLMNRRSLQRDSGMLFVFPDSDVRAFWMKNTHIPLSIAYLDESGVILNIEKMTPLNGDRIWSKGRAMYALEVNDGWFDINEISEGDIVRNLPKI
ncbi:hypothetical protein CMI47_19175 [Candidatus Pacearchaeota archaeon]|nr:hypothetical protein [Candidatus Pacearchaeota archaeon]|tara:strand:+ start:7944 stop:8366 length:423 start_codon:yes stop_codon:yes gene_type:complete